MKETVLKEGSKGRVVVIEETQAERQARLVEAYERIKDTLKVTPGQRETLRRAAEKLRIR